MKKRQIEYVADLRVSWLRHMLGEHIPADVLTEVERQLVPGQSEDYYREVLSGLDTAHNLVGRITPPGTEQAFSREQHMLYLSLLHQLIAVVAKRVDVGIEAPSNDDGG